jgi:hypothetical protein
MTHYAETTEVPTDRSRAEIERTLERYGASTFMYGWDARRAVISFEITGRRYRIVLPLPVADDPDFTISPTGRARTASSAKAAYEQAKRQRWRALALWIKAVLEAAASDIITVENALLPFTVLPDNHTVGELLEPQIAIAYQTGYMPTLLPLPRDTNQETQP